MSGPVFSSGLHVEYFVTQIAFVLFSLKSEKSKEFAVFMDVFIVH